MTFLEKIQGFIFHSNLTYNGYILLALLVGIPVGWCIYKLRDAEVRAAVYRWIFEKVLACLILYGFWKFASTVGWNGLLELIMTLGDQTRDEAIGWAIALIMFIVVFAAQWRYGMAARSVINYEVAKAQLYEKTGKMI